jgi:hypothetical protein
MFSVSIDGGEFVPLGEPVDGRYTFNIAQCAAKETTEIHSFKLKHNNVVVFDNVNNINSIAAYCLAMIDNPQAGDPLKNLCKAVLDYGISAQKYFDYHTERLAHDGEYYTDPDNIEVLPYSAMHNGDISIVKKLQIMIDLVNRTGLVYLIKSSDGGELTFSVSTGGRELTLGTDYTVERNTDGSYYLTIKNIKAMDLSAVYRVRVESGGKTLDYDYSVLAYTYRWRDDSKNKEIARTLFHYWQMAYMYVG